MGARDLRRRDREERHERERQKLRDLCEIKYTRPPTCSAATSDDEPNWEGWGIPQRTSRIPPEYDDWGEVLRVPSSEKITNKKKSNEVPGHLDKRMLERPSEYRRYSIYKFSNFLYLQAPRPGYNG